MMKSTPLSKNALKEAVRKILQEYSDILNNLQWADTPLLSLHYEIASSFTLFTSRSDK